MRRSTMDADGTRRRATAGMATRAMSARAQTVVRCDGARTSGRRSRRATTTTARGERSSGAATPTATRMTTRTRAVEPEALFEIAKVDDSVYGPVVCVAAALWVGWVFYNGSREVKAISEELEAKGYDVGSIQRLKELKFLKRFVDGGDEAEIQEAFDKIWFSRAKTIAATGDIMQVRRMTEYWRKRGVKVERLSDLDVLQDWMVKKYNKQQK
jgi:receptor expression-enhancing protein 5/6